MTKSWVNEVVKCFSFRTVLLAGEGGNASAKHGTAGPYRNVYDFAMAGMLNVDETSSFFEFQLEKTHEGHDPVSIDPRKALMKICSIDADSPFAVDDSSHKRFHEE